MKVKISSFCRISQARSLLLGFIIFFLTFHIPKLESVEFRVLGPERPVTATIGKETVLLCHLSPMMSAQNMEVRWFRSEFSNYVHLYRAGQDQYWKQMPEYQERTELLKDGLPDGNVALRILNVTLSDEGQYHCFLQNGSFYEEAILELKVTVSGSNPLISVEDYQDGGIRVVCQSAGWYPKPEVLWRDFRGQHFPLLTETYSQNKNGLFQVETSIIIQQNIKQSLSCCIKNTLLHQEKESIIRISDSFFPTISPETLALIGVLMVCLVFLIGFTVFILRERGKHAKELGKRDAVTRERDAEIKTQAAELRWRRFAVPIEEVSLTLDADTAHPQLILSEDCKYVRRGDTQQDLPDNPGRYDTYHCVLGCEGFSSGRHCWGVKAADAGVWAMGVARDSMKRKGWISPTPEEGIWAIFQCGGEYWALTSPNHTPLPLSQPPELIRVSLDYELGQVAFFDVGNQVPIFTFQTAFLTGERIRPWFRVGPIAYLELCPIALE
ncbi:butyrophilin subfamily 1 member A1-like isoform X2 [Alligator mississippiensis]|nr:butyrophilin subfamily 1 member A1-like isoform X2 [Alligator mississippiensis]XP_059571018.1 butyrophilin subfamily 1 member A1-like isoform X2 [Alligator mississippiensis]